METSKFEMEMSEYPRTIAFRHYVDDGRTYAVCCLFRHELAAALKKLRKKQPPTVKMFVGVARLHPKDVYSKASGRDTACRNITEIEGELQSSHVNVNGTEYVVRVGDAQFRFYRNHGKRAARLNALMPLYYQEL
jgi:hypothetical protein